MPKRASSSGGRFVPSTRFSEDAGSVWLEFAELAQKYKAINLGTGFPDFAPPQKLIEQLGQVAQNEDPLIHQYSKVYGHLRLCTVLAKLYSKLIARDINPNKEILISSGASEALYCSVLGHVHEGDEVIIIEPYFDIYYNLVTYSGGIPKFVPFRKNGNDQWRLEKGELEGAFNEKTKAIIINSPNNPLGVVMCREEMEIIAKMCLKWNVLCISDEVYEFLVFDDRQHIRIASFPGMWERTLTICSAGKTFFCTGWRIGWVYGWSNLIKNVSLVHTNSVFTCPTPLQEAFAIYMENELKLMDSGTSFMQTVHTQVQAKRDYLINVLQTAGFTPIVPAGGYYIAADWMFLKSKIDMSEFNDERRGEDFKFVKWLVKRYGLLVLPLTMFYSKPNRRIGLGLFRICFVKNDDLLKDAGAVFERLGHL